MTQTTAIHHHNRDSSSAPALVLAATGKTGRRVVDRLRAADRPVRPASRRSAVPFDWEDAATWAGALDGVASVYIALPLTPVPVHDFVAEAVAAGVRRLVALSGRGADTWETGFGQDMLELEDAVRRSGVEWSIVRSSNFAQNFTEDAFHAPVMAGELALPVGGVPDPFVDVEDVADVVVAALTEDDWVGQVIEVTGPEALDWDEAVATIARASDREVRFADISAEEFTTRLLSEGVPAADAAVLDAMFAESRRGLIAEPTDGIRRVLGREPRPFAEFAARAAAAGSWS